MLSYEQRSTLKSLIDQRRREALASAPQPEIGRPPNAGGGAWAPADSWQRVSLTPREQQVVELRATGRTILEISQDLGIAYYTASAHLSAAKKKLGERIIPTRVFTADAATE